MFEFTLVNVSKLGEYSEQYGQCYWDGDADELPIMFYSHNQDIGEGAEISADEKSMKKSKKGTNYYLLRKIKVSEMGERVVNDKVTASIKQPVVVSTNDSKLDKLDTILEGIDTLVAMFTDLSEKIDSRASKSTQDEDSSDEENPFTNETDPDDDIFPDAPGDLPMPKDFLKG
jgi:hypothetical protein